MTVDINLTSFSDDARVAKIVKWSVAPGSTVGVGDPIAEIETDKAVIDILATGTGILTEILVGEGEVADIGTVIGRIGSDLSHSPTEQKLEAISDLEKPAPLTATESIVMPALSPSMESASLAKWLVAVGAKVSVGEVIAEVETDKATLEVEAPSGGVIAEILVAAGTADVVVGTPIATIKVEESEAVTPQVEAAYTPATASGSPPSASPLAKRIASENGVDLGEVSGTGAKGKVMKSDVEAVMTMAAASANDLVTSLFKPGSFETIPHDGMRKTIARRLLESKQNVPHFYVTVECRIDALLELRARLNAASPAMDRSGSYKISVNDLVIKAHALALRDNPDANVSWTDKAMLRHASVDIGVAVSIPGGLITPIIRDAQQKSIAAISAEMRDLAARARNRQLKPEEYQGGTTSVSNLGMFGVQSFAAIVNPPHATILAVGAGERRPVVEEDKLVIGTTMSVTLSTDHRAVDGALAAEVLRSFKSYIESPMSIVV